MLAGLLLAGCGSRDAAPAARVDTSVTVQAAEPPDTMTRTPADTSLALLFVVHDEADWTAMEPLLAMDTSGPVNPPTPQHVSDSSFAGRWFVRGTTYQLLRANAREGLVAVVGEQQRAHCSPPADAAAVRHLRDSLGRQFSPVMVPTFARALAVDSGKPPALLGIFAGRVADETAIANAIIMLEHSEAWYEPTMVEISVGDESASWDAYSYVDVVDLEGDGVLEIVMQVMGMETRSFVVYQRDDELWREVFSGGYASAC